MASQQAVQPVLTYATEARADTSSTKQILEAAEVNALRKTRKDRGGSCKKVGC
jgi:hypothetical protein